MSNKIPSFNDICSTITESLAETILNREATIAELRVQVSNLQKVIGCYEQKIDERMNIIRDYEKTIGDLREEVSILKDECESLAADAVENNSAHEQFVRTHYNFLQKQHECEDLKKQIDGWRAECEIHERDNKDLDILRVEVRNLRNQLLVMENSHRDIDAQCKNLLAENERLKKASSGCAADPVYNIRDTTPCLFEQSDSDPVTGVQYGDLH